MTLTSLTGALAVSMVCDCVFDGNRSVVGVDWSVGLESLAGSVMRSPLRNSVRYAKREVLCQDAACRGVGGGLLSAYQSFPHQHHIMATL